MLFFIVMLCLVLYISTAIFEDQAGEHDWMVESIGSIENIIVKDENAFISSDQGILANINTKTGVVFWRNIFESSKVLKIISNGDSLLVLSKKTSNHDKGLVISSLSLLDGLTTWSKTFLSSLASYDDRTCFSDFSFDIHERKIVVAHCNSFYYLSSTGVLTWQWEAPAHVNLTLLLESASKQVSGPTRVALACHNSVTLECANLIVITVNHASQVVELEYFGPFSGSLGSLKTNLLQVPAITALSDPALVAFSTNGADALRVFHFASNSSQTVLLSSGSKIQAIPFIYHSSTEGPAPTVSVCSATGSCIVSRIQITVDSNKKPPQIKLEQLLTCDAGVIGSRFNSDSSLPIAPVCVSALQLDDDTELVSVEVDGQKSFSVHLPLTALRALSKVFVWRANAIIVGSSGFTVGVHDRKVSWLRDEALSRVRKVIMLDDAQSTADLTSAPSLQRRLCLQVAEISEWFSLIVKQASIIPSHLHNQFQVAFSTASSGSNQIVGSPRSRSEQRRRKQLEWRQQRLLGKLGDQGIGNIRNNKFGFNSVLLTVSTSRKELIEEGATFMPVSFQDAAIRVIALDSAHGDILFSMEPTIADSSLEIQWIRLLPSRMANLLIVSARDGSLFVWNINLASKAYRVVSPSRVYHGVFAMSVHTVPSSVPLFLLVGSSDTASVLPVTQECNIDCMGGLDGLYSHSLDKATGVLTSFVVSSCTSAASADTLSQCRLSPVASVAFDSASESIVSVAYPSVDAQVDKRFNILGDDSVLLKYLNPHMIVVATVSPALALSEPLYAPETGVKPHTPLCQDSGYGLETNATLDEDSALEPCRLHVTIIDIVSGKILHRVTHQQSTGPVHVAVNENYIVYSYWNAQLKRPELSSIGLFEGIIDKYGLTPFASHSSASAAAPHIRVDAGVLTSFRGQSPLAAQRTYVLPHSATALSVTQSTRGIANKNILLALSTGQVYSVDMRQIHPRRPMTEPSLPEKEEGLTQYNPFLHLVPFQAVTVDSSVNGVESVVSKATLMESTTLVLSYGGSDLHFARTQSSGGFDLLASEFNKPLLLLILGGLSLVATVLRFAYVKKIVSTTWA